jgi:hypothetical protein
LDCDRLCAFPDDNTQKRCPLAIRPSEQSLSNAKTFFSSLLGHFPAMLDRPLAFDCNHPAVSEPRLFDKDLARAFNSSGGWAIRPAPQSGVWADNCNTQPHTWPADFSLAIEQITLDTLPVARMRMGCLISEPFTAGMVSIEGIPLDPFRHRNDTALRGPGMAWGQVGAANSG